MSSAQVRWPADAAQQISLAVVEELAPQEREVALGFLEPWIEMAEDGEFVYIDSRDPGGGFGASDPLFVTIIPVVVQVLHELKGGADPGAVWSRLPTEIKRIAQAIGSKRAQNEVPVFQAAVRRVCEKLLLASSGLG